MTKLRFEARALRSYAEPVSPGELKEGEVYFSLQFVDEEMLVPVMETWVFVGRNLDPEIRASVSIFRTSSPIARVFDTDQRLKTAQSFRFPSHRTSSTASILSVPLKV